jgi:hypothetical protein
MPAKSSPKKKKRTVDDRIKALKEAEKKLQKQMKEKAKKIEELRKSKKKSPKKSPKKASKKGSPKKASPKKAKAADKAAKEPELKGNKCQGKTADGRPCQRFAPKGKAFCSLHATQAPKDPPPAPAKAPEGRETYTELKRTLQETRDLLQRLREGKEPMSYSYSDARGSSVTLRCRDGHCVKETREFTLPSSGRPSIVESRSLVPQTASSIPSIESRSLVPQTASMLPSTSESRSMALRPSGMLLPHSTSVASGSSQLVALPRTMSSVRKTYTPLRIDMKFPTMDTHNDSIHRLIVDHVRHMYRDSDRGPPAWADTHLGDKEYNKTAVYGFSRDKATLTDYLAAYLIFRYPSVTATGDPWFDLDKWRQLMREATGQEMMESAHETHHLSVEGGPRKDMNLPFVFGVYCRCLVEFNGSPTDLRYRHVFHNVAVDFHRMSADGVLLRKMFDTQSENGRKAYIAYITERLRDAYTLFFSCANHLKLKKVFITILGYESAQHFLPEMNADESRQVYVNEVVTRALQDTLQLFDGTDVHLMRGKHIDMAIAASTIGDTVRRSGKAFVNEDINMDASDDALYQNSANPLALFGQQGGPGDDNTMDFLYGKLTDCAWRCWPLTNPMSQAVLVKIV